MNINDRGSSLARFKLSEVDPESADWGHTGYVTVEGQPKDLRIANDTHLTIFFTPRKGTTFEEIQALAHKMDELLEKVHFNTFSNTAN